MSGKEARSGEDDKLSSGEPSTAGRLFDVSSSGYRQRSLPKEGISQGQRHESGSWDKDRVETASSGQLKGGQSLPRVRTSSGSNLKTELDKAAPLDLRRGAEDGESPLTKLKRRAGHELSQGLTSLLNAPSSSSSAGGSQPMGSLGAVWCWPFGAGPDFSLVVPPPDPVMLPPVGPADFQPFLRDCAAAQSRFEAVVRAHGGVSAVTSSLSAAVAGERDPEFATRPAPGEGLVGAMRVVPPMFFEEDFSLARPGTWREVVSTEDEAQRLARLDEYGGYLDVVESQLLKEIAARSEHFFEAAGVVQDLRASLHRTYSQVTALRRVISLLGAETEEAAEGATRCKRRKANMEAVLDKLKVVEEVASAQEAVGLLLPQGDYTAALDVLDSLRASLASYRTAGLHAFRHLPAQLADIAEAVDSILSSEFLRATQFQDQALVVRKVSTGLASAGSPDESSAEQLVAEAATAGEQQRGSLAETLTPLVLGLQRTGHLSATVRVLRVAAAEEARQGIREVVAQVLERIMDGKTSSGTSEKLQALQPRQFLLLLRCVAQAALASVAHIQLVRAAVEEVLRGARGGRSLVATTAADFAEVAQAVSEAAHGRWIKLLAARSSMVVGLELGALKDFLDASQHFADAMHAAGCKPVLALRNACQVQGKAYLESMHHMSLARLASVLEHETWAISDPPCSCQAIIDDIFHRAGRPIPSAARNNSSQSGRGDFEPDEDALEKLSVGKHRYSAPESELLLLELISQYLRFADVVPALAAEVAHRVVELIKVFNSRMCQLVLGAGAMQVAGLKSITAKHLALSCQCIGALIELHPALAAALVCHLPVSRRALLGPELNLVLQDLTLHRGEVHSKLVGIMRERLIAALKQLPAIAARWGSALVEGDVTPSSFSLGLAKQLRTLAQVLEPLLLQEEVRAVFGRVEALYSKNLAEAFTRLEPLGPGWERQAAADLNFLLAALKELPAARASKEASLERLQQLCEKRFRPPEESLESRLSPVPSPAKDRGSSPSRRSSIVSRLGTTKLPFFKRDRGTSAPSTETSVEHTVSSQTEVTANAVDSSTEGNEEESAPAVVAAHDSDGGEVARQEKTAELTLRETAESLLDFAAEEGVGQASKPVNRLQSFDEEDDNACAPNESGTPDLTVPALGTVGQVAKSEPQAVRGEPLQSSVVGSRAEARALRGSMSNDLVEGAKAAEAVISEAAESFLDSEVAALDLEAEAEILSQPGFGLHGADDGLVDGNRVQSTRYLLEAGSAIDTEAGSEGHVAVDADTVPNGEGKSEEMPQRNAASAIEEMLNDMQIESWESERRP